MEDKITSIIKDKSLPKSMDYQFLRKEAITNTQKISGDNWTDYNIHDPGVTILEQFCYVLTDIAYRTNLPIETLLFHAGDREQILKSNALYSPQEILPTAPLTLSDYRILILDHFPDKLSNCWIESIKDHKEGIQGLYDITLLLRSDVREAEYRSIKKKVHNLFVSHRNLAEDLNEILILEAEKIAFTAEIDIYQDENAEDILTEVLFQIEQYFNPTVYFSSLEELENKGWSLNEIFDIPSFTHGFITTDQLNPKPKEFYVSKIADHILNVKGVRGLRNLHVFQDGIPVQGDIIRVEDDKFLTLGLLQSEELDDDFKNFDITIFKGGAINKYLKSAIVYGLEVKEAKINRSYEIETKRNYKSKSNLKTSQLISFESIQKSFPGIYGVGDYTPAKEEGALRLAQTNQLKAYLMFFDQLMSNHLAQLSKLADLFSIDHLDTQKIKTYFTQLLGKNIPEASDLLSHKLAPKSVLINRKEELENQHDPKLSQELEDLLLDITQKENIVDKAVQKDFDYLIELPQEQILKSKKYKNRDIFQKLVDLKKQYTQEPKGKSKEKEAPDDENVNELVEEIKAIMKLELEELEHYIKLEQRHLDALMAEFDHAEERKNRVLTHLLARFGEKFTTDFHIKFSSLMEGQSQGSIDKKLITLKSDFLKEIVLINKSRSKGVNYLDKNAALETIPLKRKIALLLDFHSENKHDTSSLLKNTLKVKKLTGSDIQKNKKNKIDYIEPKSKTDKITFLINSSSYYNYLFKYGFKEDNYEIEIEDKVFVVYFKPPTKEIPTRLFESNSKNEAQEKLNGLINHLRKLNAKSENFYIVEHILLRPSDTSDCHFSITGEIGQKIFRSKEAKPEEVQKKVALDTLLLGCYPNNYRILQNPKKEFVVMIKNGVGVDLVKSKESFITEQGAQKFIESCISHFTKKKEAGEFDNFFQLDNQKKYFFDILNHKGDLLFYSAEALSIVEQENQVDDLTIFSLNPACYSTENNEDGSYTVLLNDYQLGEIARSYENFKSLHAADEFIQYCLGYFEKINASKAYKSIVRYRRLEGRNAEDFNSKISVVFTSWTSRFDNQEFLQLFKQTLFYCSPAHISINLVGLNYLEMKKFEDMYFQYMEELTKSSLENQELRAELANELLDILIDTEKI